MDEKFFLKKINEISKINNLKESEVFKTLLRKLENPPKTQYSCSKSKAFEEYLASLTRNSVGWIYGAFVPGQKMRTGTLIHLFFKELKELFIKEGQQRGVDPLLNNGIENLYRNFLSRQIR